MIFNPASLEIHLSEYGIYRVGARDGAEGKTYLRHLLNSYLSVTANKNALTLTYDMDRDESYYLQKINNFTGEYVMLDRFDSYSTPRVVDSIINCSRHSYVIIDSKNIDFWNSIDSKRCNIVFTEKGLIVK